MPQRGDQLPVADLSSQYRGSVISSSDVSSCGRSESRGQDVEKVHFSQPRSGPPVSSNLMRDHSPLSTVPYGRDFTGPR